MIVSTPNQRGFTVIEVLVAMFVLGIIVVGLFGFITLILKSTNDGQHRIVATALANEKMEMIRNLSYDTVGTVGGVPSGPIAGSEDIIRNNSTYTVNTDIRYVDDPFDRTVTDTPPDLLNTDYKQARVEVSWKSTLSERPVLLITQIAPSGIEGGDSLGTLIFQALSAAGGGISGATVRLVNPSVSPAVDITTSTNNDGRVIIPGLLPASGTYQISVTKAGYTTEQTYSASSSFTPDVDHSHINALAGQVTNKTFFIDTTSTLAIRTVSDLGVAIGNVAYSINGSKKIGTDNLGEDVYLFQHEDATNALGLFNYENMTWDTYAFLIDGAATTWDIKETSVPLPLAISPGTNTTLTTTLVPHENLTLHVTILDTTNQPIPNATVQVSKTGYDETISSSLSGQVFFTPLVEVGEYTVTIDAVGYQQVVQQVNVDGGMRIQVTMTAL